MGNAFISDTGDIDPGESFEYYVPCPIAHPEICATKDVERLPVLKAIAKGLRKQLTKYSCGNFFYLRFVGDTFDIPVWLCAGYMRFSNPAVGMLLPAAIDVPTRLVALDTTSGAEEMLVDITFFGRILDRSMCERLQRVALSSAPVDDSVVPASASSVRLVADWQIQLFNSEHDVYPLPKGAGHKISAAMKVMKAGLKSCADVDKAAAVKIKHPKSVGPKGHKTSMGPDSEEEWDSMGSDSSANFDGDSDPDDPVPDPPPPGPHVAPAGGLDGGPAREVRKVPFGPWSVSEVWSNGVHSGYGGNCGCHRNAGDGPSDLCKKSFTFAGSTPAETRCLAKSWLLMGLDIGEGDDARKRHVKQIRRRDIPVLSEEELDRHAAALI